MQHPFRDGDTFVIHAPAAAFGSWTLDHRGDLLLRRETWRRLPLADCNTSAELLDWIFHLLHKGLEPEEALDLLEAIDAVLNPTANYCSFGCDQQADGAAIVAAYRHGAGGDGQRGNAG